MIDLTGPWVFHQSDALDVTFNLLQDTAGNLTGNGSISSISVIGALDSGAVSTTGGSDFFFTVKWGNGAHGRYVGNQGPDGRLSGLTSDLAHPRNQATFFSG